jgi:hypothetical protein
MILFLTFHTSNIGSTKKLEWMREETLLNIFQVLIHCLDILNLVDGMTYPFALGCSKCIGKHLFHHKWWLCTHGKTVEWAQTGGWIFHHHGSKYLPHILHRPGLVLCQTNIPNIHVPSPNGVKPAIYAVTCSGVSSERQTFTPSSTYFQKDQ